MRTLTLDELKSVVPLGGKREPVLLPFLNAAMVEFDISTAERQRPFLAQIAHETCSFVYMEEIASGAAYEGRRDLGNIYPGDGVKFKGRGLIQITGRLNYSRCSDALFGDQRLIGNPELLDDPEFACRSAAWFWKFHGLNELADAGDFLQITKVINGGTNGLADRQAFYNKACEVII